MTLSIISLEEFLNIFKTKKPATLQDFLKHAQVRSGDKLILLREYRLKHNIDLDDIKLLFHHIEHKNEYLTRFYNMSLRIPENLHINETPMKNKHMNNNELVVYKNIIRNLFYLEILPPYQKLPEMLHCIVILLIQATLPIKWENLFLLKIYEQNYLKKDSKEVTFSAGIRLQLLFGRKLRYLLILLKRNMMIS